MSNIVHKKVASVAGNVTTTWVVPDNSRWKMQYGIGKLTADATAVDRWFRLGVYDPDDVLILCLCPGKEVTANQSDMLFSFLPGIYRETAFINSTLQVPITNAWIPPKYKVKLYVENGVAGDSYDLDLTFESDP